MYYKLTGFLQDGSKRVFSFERIEMKVPPVRFFVTADLALARRNNLALQELPGLCSRLLEARPENAEPGTLQLTEAQMSEFAIETARIAADAAAARALRFRGGRPLPTAPNQSAAATHEKPTLPGSNA